MIFSNRRHEATGGLDLSMVVILSILLLNVPILVLFFNQVINLCAVIGFYAAVMWHLFKQRKQVYGSEKAKYDEILKSISLTLFVLTAAYLAFLIPISIFATCSP